MVLGMQVPLPVRIEGQPPTGGGKANNDDAADGDAASGDAADGAAADSNTADGDAADGDAGDSDIAVPVPVLVLVVRGVKMGVNREEDEVEGMSVVDALELESRLVNSESVAVKEEYEVVVTTVDV